MPIKVVWLDDVAGIRYWKFDTTWTWDELYEYITPETKKVTTQYERVDLIFDYSETKTFPQNFLTNLRKASKHKTENLGTIVIIGTPFLQALLSPFYLLNKAMLKHYAFATSVGEALAIIQQDRAKSGANSA